MINKTPSQKCKQSGLDSLAELVRGMMESGDKFISKKKTLENWAKYKPKTFNACILYVKSKRGIK